MPSLKRPSADLRPRTRANLETDPCTPETRGLTRAHRSSPKPPDRPRHDTGCRDTSDRRRRGEPNSLGGKRRRNSALDPPSRPDRTTHANTRRADEPEETRRTPRSAPGMDDPPSGEDRPRAASRRRPSSHAPWEFARIDPDENLDFRVSKNQRSGPPRRETCSSEVFDLIDAPW